MTLPNEIIPISPEQLEIAQTYLKSQSIQDTATLLGISDVQVSQYLRKPEVKAYLDHVYISSGFRNRDKLAKVMEDILEKKIAELEEADMGSSKDVVDIIMAIDKMRTNELKMMIDLEKAKTANSPKVQNNVQINETPFGTGNYGKLLEALLDNESSLH